MSENTTDRSVLVIDDEPIVRESLQAWLESFGFEVRIAADGAGGLCEIAARDFGVAIIDLKLPGMDGNEVLRRARELRPHLKAIIMTAYPSRESTREASRLGVADYLVKPFDPDELRNLIEQVLASKLDPGQDLAVRGSLSALVSEWKRQQP
ncbi:MAG: response regulator [Chloroflexi bacterium]|nr:response regulator [Chloroflexota bacterium]